MLNLVMVFTPPVLKIKIPDSTPRVFVSRGQEPSHATRFRVHGFRVLMARVPCTFEAAEPESPGPSP